MLQFLRRLLGGELVPRAPRFATLDELWIGTQAMIARLEQLGHGPAAAELRSGYGALNGLTDGWVTFRDSVERVWSAMSRELAPDDRHALGRIRSSARHAMRRR